MFSDSVYTRKYLKVMGDLGTRQRHWVTHWDGHRAVLSYSSFGCPHPGYIVRVLENKGFQE